MEKRQEFYHGKAKTVYTTDDPKVLVMHYRDDVSAFDGAKLAKLERKGETNNKFNAYIMGKLAAVGVSTHFMRVRNARESLVRAMKMIPVECVVRNICAGSMAKRYGIEEGTRLPEPIFEFFLKSDPLHDPLVNDDHIRVLGWATVSEIGEMKALTHKVNAVLTPLFAKAAIDLVDYKLEFGHPVDDVGGPLVLGDEFTPDGCRLHRVTCGRLGGVRSFLAGLYRRGAGVLRSGGRLVCGFLGGDCGLVRRCLGVGGLLVVAAAHDGERESSSYEKRPLYHHRFP